jgi:hypothetical protein
MAYWQPTPQQVRSFAGWTPRFEAIAGPLVLWSFSSDPERPDKGPMYWMEKRQVVTCVDQSRRAEDANLVFEFLRRAVALREDWGNKMAWAFELDLPADATLEAWVGKAKAQQAAMKAGRLQARSRGGLPLIFEGGATQYLIDQTDRGVRWMVGPPIRTALP